MKRILHSILIGAALTSSAYADLNKAPTDIKMKKGMAIFVDFTRVDTEITYDFKSETAKAITTIEFNNDKSGFPIFDLIPELSSATLDAHKVQTSKLNAPGNITSYRFIEKEIQAGSHKLVIENEVSKYVKFSSDFVSSAFWMSDLSDKSYLERYIPTNIEYDQFEMNMTVKMINKGSLAQHEVFTNGALTQNGNEFNIVFPNYFTASSFFFHITKKDKFKSERFTYKSINGNVIPVVVYTGSMWTSVSKIKSKTISALTELESTLGAWSHPSLTVYVAGQGGMEFSGATITSMSALGHELTHSYFARGVMPIDGNSGWMDEAIASWRDGGYKVAKLPNFSSTSMSAHSQYTRVTDRKAYTQGANFMAYLNGQLKTLGGLKTFLKDMHAKYTHTNITTYVFKKELELFSGKDYTKEFNQYIFGKKAQEKSSEMLENPNHPVLTEQQLINLL